MGLLLVFYGFSVYIDWAHDDTDRDELEDESVLVFQIFSCIFCVVEQYHPRGSTYHDTGDDKVVDAQVAWKRDPPSETDAVGAGHEALQQDAVGLGLRRRSRARDSSCNRTTAMPSMLAKD